MTALLPCRGKTVGEWTPRGSRCRPCADPETLDSRQGGVQQLPEHTCPFTQPLVISSQNPQGTRVALETSPGAGSATVLVALPRTVRPSRFWLSWLSASRQAAITLRGHSASRGQAALLQGHGAAPVHKRGGWTIRHRNRGRHRNSGRHRHGGANGAGIAGPGNGWQAEASLPSRPLPRSALARPAVPALASAWPGRGAPRRRRAFPDPPWSGTSMSPGRE